MKNITRSLLLAAAVTLPAAGILHAQTKGRHSARMYSASTETTIKGTVLDVTQGTGGKGMGTHLTVKTDQGSMEVRVGPAKFVAGQGFSFAKGDAVAATGSKVTLAGTETLIAREIVKGGKTLTLRDKSGQPAWRGRHAGADKP